MSTILVAADGSWVREQVRTAIATPEHEILEVSEGRAVRALVADGDVDLVVVDMQIGSMGGVAVAVDLRLEASGDRAPWVPILLLLDREADEFLARRAGVDGVLVKPLEPTSLRRVTNQLLEQRVSAPSTPGLSGGVG